MSGRLARRILGAALAVGPAVWFGLTWLQQRNLSGTQQVALAEVDRLRERIVRLRETPAAPAGEAAPPQWRLGDKAQVAALMHDLEALGRVEGLELDAVRSPRSATSGRLGFTLTGRGTTTALCTLLANIEAHATVFVVEAVRVIPHESGGVAFELTLASYYRIDGGEK